RGRAARRDRAGARRRGAARAAGPPRARGGARALLDRGDARPDGATVRRGGGGGGALSRPALSVAVITKNEAHRIERCLRSVDFADEIVVVDSGSDDGTPDIARRLGATVIAAPDWPGFGPQKNRALDA